MCSVQVQEDGLFSLDYPFGFSTQHNIIFPFWSDADTTRSGSVKYLNISDGSELEQLSSLIRAKQGVDFDGSWALIAEWRDIPEYSDRYKPEIVSPIVRDTVSSLLSGVYVTHGYGCTLMCITQYGSTVYIGIAMVYPH